MVSDCQTADQFASALMPSSLLVFLDNAAAFNMQL